jgi:hypothetical protein
VTIDAGTHRGATAPADLSHDDPLPRLQALGALLADHHAVWHPRPFEHRSAPWETRHPDASAWLHAQDPDDLDQPGWTEAAHVPAVFRQWAQAVTALAPHPTSTVALSALPARFGRGLPGRKRNQIEGFAAPIRGWLGPDSGPLTLLDWCGGKAWLGQSLLLGRLNTPDTRLRVVEWQAALGADAEARCAQMDLPCEAHIADALDPATARHLIGADLAVGLHACGDLHAALLRGASAAGVPRLALAPCCYNKVAQPEAAVLSLAGQAQGFDLVRSDLDLIHREVVVAHADDLRRSRQGQAWRLGFDAWRVACGGPAAYRPLPAFGRDVLAKSFVDFCAQFRGEVAAMDGSHAFVTHEACAPFEAEGWARLRVTRRLEAVRGLFRPALESWLVLDRAQFLAERGYRTAVIAFCDRAASPRNALIVAWLQT